MKQGNINMKMPFLHCIMIYTGRNYDEKKKKQPYVPMNLFKFMKHIQRLSCTGENVWLLQLMKWIYKSLILECTSIKGVKDCFT